MMRNEATTLPETAAVDYLKAKQFFSEYDVCDTFCSRDGKVVGTTEAAMAEKALRHIDEIEYWIEVDEIEDAKYSIELVVNLAQRLEHAY